MQTMHNPSLGLGFKFKDLYHINSLKDLDKQFLFYLESNDEKALELLKRCRQQPTISRLEYSKLINMISSYVESFIAELFLISKEIQKISNNHSSFKKIYEFKRNAIQRRILNKFREYDFSSINIGDVENKLQQYFKGEVFSEQSFVDTFEKWLLDPGYFEKELVIAEIFIAWNCLIKIENSVKDWVLFRSPKKKDYHSLIDFYKKTDNGIEVLTLKEEKLHERDGFNLTDCGGSIQEALDQANYCIYCHKQEKDSCSRGSYDKEGEIKHNPLGDSLKGCPLDEKISEMNELKASGLIISALGVAIIDNPMLAATGHRICNDCMKSCIYQKQDPVNIPKVETRVLQDVLNLPWGFEIYSLLTRWNPFNIFTPYPKNDTGKKVLVVGQGPAGFTLAHYLLNQGHTVIGIDGLKIEPLSNGLVKDNFLPIRDIGTLYESLEERKQYGFGGVTEYGITARWNKNFLTVIRMILERRDNFKLFGGIRFGSNLNRAQAFELGFDHIALALGAGKPNLLDIPDTVALGVKTASDFLMSLQLNGASQKNSIANLQVRMPIVVIGGGLTAIDTATEAKAYYVRQVEKLYERYEILCMQYGKSFIEESWLDIDKEIASEFFNHALIFRKERDSAKKKGKKPNFTSIIRKLGGVKVLYRKSIEDSPSYRLNHEELELALEEGIEIVENVSPKKFITDKNGCIKSIQVDISGKDKTFDARTVLIAIGTHPNVILAQEDSEVFKIDTNGYFKFLTKDDNFSIYKDSFGRGITVFGDLHPKYKGNVVKAMSSAKDGYKVIDKQLELMKKGQYDGDWNKVISDYFSARVVKVNELAKGIIEIIIRAPSAVQNFQPGQFYRLQNFLSNAKVDKKNGSTLAMEGLAVTGAWVDKKESLIATVVLEVGGSSKLCRYLLPGEDVVLMGPTGLPTEIVPNEAVMLVGGGLGNAVLFSIGNALKEQGNKVLYFAGYRDKDNVFMQDKVEEAADQVIWCCDNSAISPRRKNDDAFKGNIIEAIKSYAAGEIGNKMFEISSINRMIVIGSDKMMEAVQIMRKSTINKLSKITAVASINSPMQCMMKEICAQCLQRHVDPITGIESYVYSCTNQDQDMNKVDFKHLNDRLKQNSLQEKITSKWIYHVLRE